MELSERFLRGITDPTTYAIAQNTPTLPSVLYRYLYPRIVLVRRLAVRQVNKHPHCSRSSCRKSQDFTLTEQQRRTDATIFGEGNKQGLALADDHEPMKYIISAATFALLANAQGQNLVPNWSFEEYTECPTNLSQIDNAVAWQRIGGSPDLYNSCGASDTVNVPSSFAGYQEAHTGNGYTGVITYHHDAREYVQAQLDAPLMVGVRTHVCMSVSPGGYADVGQISPELMSSGIGMRMSVNAFPIPDEYIQYYFNTAIIHMATILEDTANWTQLYAEFIPDSAYRYVQVGNFFGEDSTLAVTVDPDGGGLYAYAFIDDVCVSQVDGVCSALGANGADEAKNTGFTARLDEQGNLLVDWGTNYTTPAHIRVFDVTGRSLAHMTVAFPLGRGSYNIAPSAGGAVLVFIISTEHTNTPFKLLRTTP